MPTSPDTAPDSSTPATRALRPEQRQALDYLRRKGTEAPLASLHRRTRETFQVLHDLLQGISAEQARRKPSPKAWCVQEIVDHLLVSNRPARDQLQSVLEGQSVDETVPASLQSNAPMERPWPELVAELQEVHGGILELLENASDDVPQEATVPVVMVVKCATESGAGDGATESVEWVERFDWKACALVIRVHVLEHIAQIRRTLTEVADSA